jgi:hypothetical protein
MPDFFAWHNFELPQLDDDQKTMPEEVFSQQEDAIKRQMKSVLQASQEKSVPFFELLSLGCLLSGQMPSIS